ncbi:MAG: tyrosine-type recombinase/integrase [Oxalobacter sp.]|nr:tyrosine-type recombinase/integrase [Oxalobacter sp.]
MKTVKPLTPTQVNKAKSKANNYSLFDGDGLFLYITTKGSKLWRMKISLDGKYIQLSFGKYPDVSLEYAREKRREVRTLVAQGLDPRKVWEEREQAEKAKTENTFEKVARDWHQNTLSEWKDITATRTLSRMEQDIFPTLGNIPIAEIKPRQIIGLLKKIEARAATTAGKVKRDIVRIFNFATQREIVTPNHPATCLNGVLNRRTEGHYSTIQSEELPEFLKELDKINMFAGTRIAINLMMLLFMRTNELIGAKWSEIDLEKGVWIIPWQRMKMGSRKINPVQVDHLIDLPKQAIALLTELKTLSGHREHLFPSWKNPRSHMSNGAILMALKRMGYHGRMTGHGFRALAASTLGELGYRREVIERQLAHKEKNKILAAYHRAPFRKERKALLQGWADYIDSIRHRNMLRLVKAA